MELALKIDTSRFVQQIQIQNEMLENEVQKGLDAAFEELSKDGTIETMIKDAVRKNIMDSFSRWIFQTDIRKNIETQITSKLSERIDTYTTEIIDKVAESMNLPKD